MNCKLHPHNRICCDGLCQQGRDCPAVAPAAARLFRPIRFAPGVIDGPAKRLPLFKRLGQALSTVVRK
ncbi:MAG: hypothetical protein K2W93_08915 [Burkholderiaceae bacterium]|nr:hypothetical protein [Burkholderiaceae bacterium]